MQRRLCLTAEHLTCPAFEAARAARPIVPERMRTLPRPLARTTPVVLDHGRIALTLPAWRLDRSIRQGVLVVFMGLAFVAILLAKLTGGGTTAAAVDASPSANPSVLPSSAPSLAGGDATPLATTAAIVSAAPTSGTLAATSPPAIRTYKVKAGDTLVGIAARFKTTPKALATLNGITNASSLKVGQTLKLP
jgi:LysM repeat protein